MATRRGVACRPFQPLVDLARVFAPPLLQPATENVRGNLQTDREQRRFVPGASLREMRPRAVNQYVEPRMQPEVNLNTDAIVVTVGMPAQRQQVLSGAGKKLLLAQGDMVLASGVGIARDIAVRDQQL